MNIQADIDKLAKLALPFAEEALAMNRRCALINFEGGFVAFFHKDAVGFDRILAESVSAVNADPNAQSMGSLKKGG